MSARALIAATTPLAFVQSKTVTPPSPARPALKLPTNVSGRVEARNDNVLTVAGRT